MQKSFEKSSAGPLLYQEKGVCPFKRTNSFSFQIYKQMTMSGPAPLVVSGPSGAGKSTLLRRMMEQYKDVFGLSVSHTTRYRVPTTLINQTREPLSGVPGRENRTGERTIS